MMQIPEFWDMYGTTAPDLGRFDAKFGLRSPLLGFALFGPKTAILNMPNLAGSWDQCSIWICLLCGFSIAIVLSSSWPFGRPQFPASRMAVASLVSVSVAADALMTNSLNYN